MVRAEVLYGSLKFVFIMSHLENGMKDSLLNGIPALISDDAEVLNSPGVGNSHVCALPSNREH